MLFVDSVICAESLVTLVELVFDTRLEVVDSSWITPNMTFNIAPFYIIPSDHLCCKVSHKLGLLGKLLPPTLALIPFKTQLRVLCMTFVAAIAA